MNITVTEVEASGMPYPTVGNWTFDKDGNLQITVLKGLTPTFSLGVALHEIVEAHLCKSMGITEESVNEFDIAFEGRGCDNIFKEPGDDPDSPYYQQHKSALIMEHAYMQVMCVPWQWYDDAVDEVFDAAFYKGPSDGSSCVAGEQVSSKDGG